MILLKKLTWSNAFSYGENNVLNFSENRITQILGTNGVGKSSIPLTLEEVLFNKNSKGIKKADIPNRLLNTGYSINLTFDKDNVEYEIDLNRKSSLKVKLLKNGEDISSHTATGTYKTIEEILGIDFKTFSQVVYQNTNASLNFLTATDANRKKFLIDLLGLEHYTKIFELIKSASREVENEYAGLEGKISTIEKWLEKNKLTDTTPLELKNLPEISEEDQKELSSLMAEFQNISATNRKISQNNQYRKLLKEINIEQINAIEVEKEEDATPFKIAKSENEKIILSSKKMINHLRGLGDKCPTCEQEVDKDFIDSLLTEEESKIEKAEIAVEHNINAINLIEKNNRLYKKKVEGQREWQSLFNSVDKELPTEPIDAKELQSRIENLKADISKQQHELRLAQKENEQASAHNARINVILEQTQDFEQQLTELQVSFKDIKNKKSNLEVLKKAFSTNGLIAYKIENLVKELEAVTGAYLSELSDGRFTLNFSVTNDKLNVEITDNGNVVDILALSSGELARVNTATLLGIRKIMSSISSNKINVLFLDEVMNVLDEQGREKLVEVLLGEELNTYIVSHQWSHPLLEKIEVQKLDGISRIVNG